MGLLDQITNMKKQGIPNDQIINELASQGVSPQEILNALKQSEIKNAVTGYSDEESNEMQPSIMPKGEAPQARPRQFEQEQPYQPPQQQEYVQETYAPQQPTYAPQVQEPQYYSPENAGYQEYQQTGGSADMMMEVADQVFSEKIKKLQKVLETTSESTILLQNKFENLSDRLKKIENMIDKLQIAILEKVGSYGSNLNEIKKEMSMMQDSFSKVISAPKHKEESEKKSSKKK
jgi:DNA-binding protein H-NS